jgi:hypothetical protein
VTTNSAPKSIPALAAILRKLLRADMTFLPHP